MSIFANVSLYNVKCKILSDMKKEINAMINLEKMNKKFEEIMEKETFSGKNQTAPCNIDDIIVPKSTLCDVCGSNDIIEAPHMGINCNRCNPF